jgi:hypothetical protein
MVVAPQPATNGFTHTNGVHAKAATPLGKGASTKPRLADPLDSLASTRALIEATLPDGIAKPVVLDGYSLQLGDVVNTARHLATAEISDDPAIAERIAASVAFLAERLSTSVCASSALFVVTAS